MNELILCQFCGKQLKGIIFHSKNGKEYCGGKHERLNINRNNVFNEQVNKKLIQYNKKIN